MRDAWQILRDAGLPIAAERTRAIHNRAELAGATRAAVAARPSGRDAEALAAFVFAWHHHWPGAYDAAFGEHGALLVGWAGRQFTDDNRYLKLRRIAISNLAHIL